MECKIEKQQDFPWKICTKLPLDTIYAQIITQMCIKVYLQLEKTTNSLSQH